ncbi:hypothetical protein P3X46_002707 [Hevea brasiliensis]|uniref:non-specific serine/threonine protein kinase n=1 Tax=Hevea brasiliensis TaxID=3981 RepID=A0ABQ9N3W2_HEVBR|nr:hypothetical protein P3X46_002707 [Hevea brasiliensis]
MAHYRVIISVSLYACMWALLGTSTTSTLPSDISCLKSIRDSVEDPDNLLRSSWNFKNDSDGFICSFAGVECWHPNKNRVLSLTLHKMKLKGQFPRGIGNCTSLTGLDLSGNEFHGPIPLEMGKRIPLVTRLDLSFNNFSGEIPSSIADCSLLNVLNLDHNRLIGHIPQEIGGLGRIKTFSVFHNLLSGQVPIFANATVSADAYANNNGLSGGPLKRCPESSRKFNWRFDYSFKGGVVIGYAFSLVSAIVVYASYCVPWVYMGKKNGMITIPELVMLMMLRRKNKKTQLEQLGSLSTMELLLEKEISTSEHFVTRMSFIDLCNATENFSRHNIIGVGQIGTMYKASLPNGWSLANQKTRLFVYKYVSNGNLFDWLHSGEGKKKVLNGPLRMKIAAGIGKGLAWLHHCWSFRVAHLNISSKCILLHKNFEPKLSNFGMSTFINPNEVTSSRGFFMDVEFWEECFLKENVFNFGIVLLELITGKMSTVLSSSHGSLDEWLSDLWQGHDNEIFQCLRIARNCLQRFPDQRPTMLDVYMAISNINYS